MVRLPLDKNWIKCCTVMEVQIGGSTVQDFLNKYPDDEMSDDVKACRDLLNNWYKEYIPVRNFRSLAVCADMLKDRRRLNSGRLLGNGKLLMGSQLRKRKLYDENSSQGKSAFILTTRDSVFEDRIMKNVQFDVLSPHMQNAIRAKNYFKKWKRPVPESIIYREDETLKRQFDYLTVRLCGFDIKLDVRSAEDVPLSVAMEEMTIEEAAEKYPQLRHHETDRIKEMENIFKGQYNSSLDHRIVMARAFRNVIFEDHYFLDVERPEAVGKSFPKFWEYLKEVVYNYK